MVFFTAAHLDCQKVCFCKSSIVFVAWSSSWLCLSQLSWIIATPLLLPLWHNDSAKVDSLTLPFRCALCSQDWPGTIRAWTQNWHHWSRWITLCGWRLIKAQFDWHPAKNSWDYVWKSIAPWPLHGFSDRGKGSTSFCKRSFHTNMRWIKQMRT